MTQEFNQARGGRFIQAKDVDAGKGVVIRDKDGSLRMSVTDTTLDKLFDVGHTALVKLRRWDSLPELDNNNEAISMWYAKTTVIYTGISNGAYTRGNRYRPEPDEETNWIHPVSTMDASLIMTPDIIDAVDIKASDSVVFFKSDESIAGYIWCEEGASGDLALCLTTSPTIQEAYISNNIETIYTYDSANKIWIRTMDCGDFINAFDKCTFGTMSDSLAMFFKVHDPDKGTPFKWKSVVNEVKIPCYPYNTQLPVENTCYLNPTSSMFYFGPLPKTETNFEIMVDTSNLDSGKFYGNSSIFFEVTRKAITFKIKGVRDGRVIKTVMSGDSIYKLGKYRIDLEVLPDGELIALVRSLVPDVTSTNEADYCYGFRYNMSKRSPAVSRIEMTRYQDDRGQWQEIITEVNSFSQMPCHDFKRCLMKRTGSKPEYYLDPTDSRFKEDGVTPADLTGRDGDVVVEIPKTYLRITRPDSDRTNIDADNDGAEYLGRIDYLISRKPIPDPPRDSSGNFTSVDRLIFNGVHPLFGLDGAPEVDPDTGKLINEKLYTYNDKNFFGVTYPANQQYDSKLLKREEKDFVYAAAFASCAAHNGTPTASATLKATASASNQTVTPTATKTFESGCNYPMREIGYAVGNETSNILCRSIAPYRNGDMVHVNLPGARVMISNGDDFVVPEGEIWYFADEKITPYTDQSLTSHTFENGKGIIKTSANSVQDYFRGTDVKSVYISEGFVSIDDYAFANCTVKKIKFPSTILRLDDYAFDGSGLESVYLNINGSLQLGTNTFANCSSLKSIVIIGGGNIQSYNSFYNLTSLETFVVDSTQIQLVVGSSYTGIFDTCLNVHTIILRAYGDDKPIQADMNNIHTIDTLVLISKHIVQITEPMSVTNLYLDVVNTVGLSTSNNAFTNVTLYRAPNTVSFGCLSSTQVYHVPWDSSQNPSSFPYGASSATVHYNEPLTSFDIAAYENPLPYDPSQYPALMPGGCDKVFISEQEGAPDDVSPSVDYKYTATMSFIKPTFETYDKDYHLYTVPVTVAYTEDPTFVSGKTYWIAAGSSYAKATVTAGEAVPANTYYDAVTMHWVLTDGDDTLAYSNEFDPATFTTFGTLTWTVVPTAGESISYIMQVRDSEGKVYVGPRHYRENGSGFDAAIKFNPNWALNYRPAVSIPRSSFNGFHREGIHEYHNSDGTITRLPEQVSGDIYIEYTKFSWDNGKIKLPGNGTRARFRMNAIDTPAYRCNSNNANPNGYYSLRETVELFNDNTIYLAAYYGKSATTIGYKGFTGTNIASTPIKQRKYTNGTFRVEYITPDDERTLPMPDGRMIGKVYPDEWRIIEYSDNTYTTIVYVLDKNKNYNEGNIAANIDYTNKAYYVDENGIVDRNWYIKPDISNHTTRARDGFEICHVVNGEEVILAKGDANSYTEDTTFTSYFTYDHWIDTYNRYIRISDSGFRMMPGSAGSFSKVTIPMSIYECKDTNPDPRHRIWSFKDGDNLYKIEFNYKTLRYELVNGSHPDQVLFHSNKIGPATCRWTNVNATSFTAVSNRMFAERSMTLDLRLLPGYATGTTTFTKAVENDPADNPYGFTYILKTSASTPVNIPYRVIYVSEDTFPEYSPTADSTAQEGKTYYTRTGEGTDADPYVYTVQEVAVGGALAATSFVGNHDTYHNYSGCWVIVKYSDADRTKDPEVVSSELDLISARYVYSAANFYHGLYRCINPEARNEQIYHSPDTGDTINNTLVYKCDGTTCHTGAAAWRDLLFYVDEHGSMPAGLAKVLSADVIEATRALVVDTNGIIDEWVDVRYNDTFTSVTAVMFKSERHLESEGPWNAWLHYTAPYGSPDGASRRVLKIRNESIANVYAESVRAYNCHTRLKQFFCLMMVIDGATFDTQTGISTGKSWLSTFDYYRSTFNGRTVPLGNINGEVLWDPDVDINILLSHWSDSAKANTRLRVVAFNWRGFENPFGNIGEYEDGIIPCTKYMDGNESSHPGYNETNLCQMFSDTMNIWNVYDSQIKWNGNNQELGYSFVEYYPGVTYEWRDHAFPASGWIRRWDPVTFLPTRAGGSIAGASTYCCDYNATYGTVWDLQAARYQRFIPVNGIPGNGYYRKGGLMFWIYTTWEIAYQCLGTRLQF